MKITTIIISTLLFAFAPGQVITATAPQTPNNGPSVEHDAPIPQLAFATQELKAALKESGREDLRVRLIVKPDASSPEGFEIKTSGPQLEVIGAEASGAMYGGIEVAEYLKLGLPIANVKRKPFVGKRGIKFNIPLDARSPSSDDSGAAANENIANMWDFEGFWKPYLDDLARYNVLSLWTCHPYPHMVKTLGYEQADPDTIAYLRAAVKEMVLNYPSITAIAVAAGENDHKHLKGDDSTEAYIFKTSGLGVMDAKADPIWDPDRQIRFIFRNHSTEIEDVQAQFADKDDGPVEVSIKYCVGRLYSSRRPLEWEKRAIKDGWGEAGDKAWLHIRNDDVFIHRWGSPDYVRYFIREMPHDQSPGFMMGSDGYVWGRMFNSTVPELQEQLEQLGIDKHWYNFRLWGELAYHNELGDDYWIACLKHRFSLSDGAAKLLHDTWQTVSEVVPQLNRSVYEGVDAAFASEGCITGLATATGFLTIPHYYYGEEPPVYRRQAMRLSKNPPAGEVQCVSVPDWRKAYLEGKLERGTA